MATKKITTTDGWQTEVRLLRANHEQDSQRMADFVKLFEAILPNKSMPTDPETALCTLALHHLAMNFHVVMGAKAHKLLQKSCIFALPESFGFKDKRHDKLRVYCKESCVCKEPR